MNFNQCQYCSNNDMHWIFKDKENKIALGTNMNQNDIQFTFQYGDQTNLKLYWSGFLPNLKYCPWCGRKLNEV